MGDLMRIDVLPIFRFLNPILISILFYYSKNCENTHRQWIGENPQKNSFSVWRTQLINKQINETIISGHSGNLTPIHQ